MRSRRSSSVYFLTKRSRRRPDIRCACRGTLARRARSARLSANVRCSVSLIRLVSPESDPEIIAIVAMLEAHNIPSYVRGGGIGGLFPGVQINAVNTRTIMIPEEQADIALDPLREFQSQQSEPDIGVIARKSGLLRNLIELFLFGWFLPRS
jgi:hypothetical protein